MFKNAVWVCIVAFCFSPAFAANNIFSGGGDGTSWSDSSNWTLGTLPVYNEDGSMLTFVGVDATSDLTVNIDGTAGSGQTWLGRPEDPAFNYTLNLQPGTDYNLVRMYIGYRGTMNMYGGSLTLDELKVGAGKFNLYNGDVTVTSDKWIALNSGSYTGTIGLYGGTLSIQNGDKFSYGNSVQNPNFVGVLDVSGGMLIMEGDTRTAIQWHITNGNFIMCGGAGGVGPVLEYDETEDVTTLYCANRWTGNGDGTTWSDAANWSLGMTPIYTHPTITDFTFVGMKAGEDYNVTIDTSDARSGKAWLGRPEDPAGTYTLNIENGGYYYLVRLYIGPRGVLNMNGGGFDAWEGRFADSTINLNGGLFVVRSGAWAFMGSSVTTLNGGTLQIKNGTKFSVNSPNITTRNPEFTGLMDFRGGTLMMDGDCTIALQWHVDNGNIVAWGGTNPDYEIQIVYNADSNKTTVQAVNVVAAKYTWPQNGMELTVDDRETIQLNWQPGRDVTDLIGYNIYVSDPNSTTLNLVSDAGTPYTGLNWQISAARGANYLWRVDEVTSSGTGIVTGDTWSVTINSEPLELFQRTHDGSLKTLDYQWIACGDGTSWNDELNWHSEVAEEPIPKYTGHEGKISESRMPNTTMTVSYFSLGGNFFLGYDGLDQVVNLENGYWQLYRFYCRANGTVNIDAGSRCRWIILESDGGVFNLEGYLRITLKYWSFKQTAEGRGGIKVLDGLLWIETMRESGEPFDTGETGNIDIYEGVVKFNGDQTATVQGWINAGHIVAYGGTDPNSIVDMYYDTVEEQTVLTARADKRKAYAPIPADKAVDAYATTLGWTAGAFIDSETLYLGEALKADLNEDETVDFDDLMILSENYLSDGWQEVAQADITGDNEVNLRDFAVMAAEWQQSMTLYEMATLDSDPNSSVSYPVTLEYDTKYYWMVDSTVGTEVVTGDLWSFTTGSDPMLADNEYPVTGDNNVVNAAVTLTWETDPAITGCNVYFADNYNQASLATTSDPAYQTNTSTGQWNCPSLTSGQKYYWRIDTVEGSTVRKGKVWSFMVVDAPMGLYAESGLVKLASSQFKGYGVNYIDPFTRRVQNQDDFSYEPGFAALADKNIPFVRMWGSCRHVKDWALYFEDKDRYFEIMDDVMATAEANNVGVIIDLFWSWYLLADVVGEHMDQLGNPNSDSCKFMENYIREIYRRYKNCPVFYGWELGNEYNLAAAGNALAPVLEAIYGHPLTRDNTLDRINNTLARQYVANFNAAVRKVDKARMTTNGYSINKTGETYGGPEVYEDHAAVEVASIHYYGTGGATPAALAQAVTDTASWGKPLYVGEFGVKEGSELVTTTVADAFSDMLDDMTNAGVTFASVWVYNFPDQDDAWSIAANNSRSYMLDMLEDVNDDLNP